MSDTLAICPPLNVLFTNLSTGASSYAWDFGNSTTSVLQNPSVIYTVPGVFTVQLIATNTAGCKDTANGTANVLGYAGGLSYTPLSGCAPLAVQFTATLSNVPTIVWDFSDGVTQPANGASTTTHIYTTPGIYIPRLILSDGQGCLNSSNGLDTIKVDGVLPGFVTSPPCENTTVQFQDTSFSFFSPISYWSWSFNNGQSTSNVNNPTKFYPTAGKYPVLLIATNANGCKDTIEKEITIYPPPTIVASLDTIICLGDEAKLLASGGSSYTWTPINGLSCSNCVDPLASPAMNTNYIVTGTDIHGCKNKDTVLVALQYITTSEVGDGGEICDDSTFQLSATGAHKYEWKPAESLSNSTIPSPVASPHVTTIYRMTAWEGSCPPDSHKVQVVVYPKPLVDAGRDETIVSGSSVMLNARGSNLTSFKWSPLVTLSCEDCSNPVATPKVTTSYKVIVSSIHGCKTADTVTVHVICDDSQLFIPSYFSPNGDGNNDVFYPRGEGLKKVTAFRIYDRWGALLFERNNIQLNDAASAWDGTFKGRQLSPDVFVYVIQGECENGQILTWKGDVTLGR
jgi:gliding motility-associated-like protein